MRLGRPSRPGTKRIEVKHKAHIIKRKYSGRRLKAAIRVNDHDWQALAPIDEFSDCPCNLWSHAGTHQPALALVTPAQGVWIGCSCSGCLAFLCSFLGQQKSHPSQIDESGSSGYHFTGQQTTGPNALTFAVAQVGVASSGNKLLAKPSISQKRQLKLMAGISWVG
jgi:hypothetical protein